MIRILTLLDDILSSTSAQGGVLIRKNVPHDLGCSKSVRMHRGGVRREVRGGREVTKDVRGEVRGEARGEVSGEMEREGGIESGGGGGRNGDRKYAYRGVGKGRSRREEGKEQENLLTSHINTALNFNHDLQHPVNTVNAKSVSAPLKFNAELDLEDCLLIPKQGGEDPVFRSDTVIYCYHTHNEI